MHQMSTEDLLPKNEPEKWEDNNKDDKDDTSEKSEVEWNQHLILLIAFPTIGGFMFGYDTGVISGAMLLLRKQFNFSSFSQEIIVSMTVLSAAIWSFLAGIFAYHIGRKMCLIIAGAMYFLGSLILGLANGFWLLVIGRFIVGIGVGICATVCPIYIAETVPESIRGRLVLLYNCFIIFGQFFATLFNAALYNVGPHSWRYMLSIAAVPGLIQMVGSIFLIPESFRWLVSRGEMAKAVVVVAQNRRVSVKAAEKYVEKIHQENIDIKNEMKRQMETQQHGSKNIVVRVLYDRVARKSLLIGCTIQALAQAIGINTVMYYTGILVRMAGTSSISVSLWYTSAIVGACLIPSMCGFILIDRIGRRKLTLLSLTGSFLSLILVAAVFQVMSHDSNPVTDNSILTSDKNLSSLDRNCAIRPNCEKCISGGKCGFCLIKSSSNSSMSASCLALSKSFSEFSLKGVCNQKNRLVLKPPPHYLTESCPSRYSWLIILGLILYLCSFACGMGPIPWTITSEIYPLWCREFNMSISTMINWIVNLVVSLTFLTLTEVITKYGTFYVYGAIAFAGLFFVYFFLPETNQKTLEEITILLGSNAKS